MIPKPVRKTDHGVISLIDGSIAFSMDRAIEEFSKVPQLDYTVNDLILMLLYAQPEKSIVGRIAVFKEIFIIEREVFGKKLFNWEEVPGEHQDDLQKFLVRKLKLEWVKWAEFSKSKNNRKINIKTKDKLISIIMDYHKTKATIDYGKKDFWKWYSFFVKKYQDNYELYVKTRDIEDCLFIPYFYGPYSFYVAHKLNELSTFGFIEKSGEKNTSSEEFQISNKGIRAIKEKYDELPNEISNSLKTWRKGLDQLGTDWILNYVYKYYPQFKSKSKIAYRYKPITWGQGKG